MYLVELKNCPLDPDPYAARLFRIRRHGLYKHGRGGAYVHSIISLPAKKSTAHFVRTLSHILRRIIRGLKSAVVDYFLFHGAEFHVYHFKMVFDSRRYDRL